MKEEIKQTVHDIVLNSNQRLTPIDVEKRVATEATEIRADKQMIKTAITELVNEGVFVEIHISWHQFFGKVARQSSPYFQKNCG